MSQEHVTNIWRYNRNFTVSKFESSQFSGSSGTNAKKLFRASLFSKETMKSVIGVLPLDTVKYLKEIAPGLAIKSLTAGPEDRQDNDDNDAIYKTRLRFHMQEGMTLAEMLYNEVTLDELAMLTSTMRRFLNLHPENAPLLDGIASVSEMVRTGSITVVDIISRCTTRDKTARIVRTPWVELQTDEAQEQMSGRVDVYYNEHCVRPFAVRITNCPTSIAATKLMYPYYSDKIRSHIITLTAEEFISKFLLAVCESESVE